MYFAKSELISKAANFDLNKVSDAVRHDYQAAAPSAFMGSSNSVLRVDNGVAKIKVSGMLTKDYSLMTFVLGGTSYDHIIEALSAADSNDSVNKIHIQMDSGGGQVKGLFEVVEWLRATEKPLECHISGECCSAAYAIAANCNKIIAKTDGDMVGSIGVVLDVAKNEKVVSVSSSNAPKKRPDVTTAEGVNDVRDQIDEYEALFIDAIAEGRGVSVDDVKRSYGRGAVMTAKNALKNGMIDAIGDHVPQLNKSISLNQINGEKMNKTELKAAHPELYASIVAEGVSSEKDRASAFLELGAASGSMALAHDFIKNGAEHSATINAKFAAAGMELAQKANMTAQLAADNVDTSGVVAKSPEANDFYDKVAAAYDAGVIEDDTVGLI